MLTVKAFIFSLLLQFIISSLFGTNTSSSFGLSINISTSEVIKVTVTFPKPIEYSHGLVYLHQFHYLQIATKSATPSPTIDFQEAEGTTISSEVMISTDNPGYSGNIYFDFGFGSEAYVEFQRLETKPNGAYYNYIDWYSIDGEFCSSL